MHFNSHAHVERDPPGYGNVYKNDNFNSHAHVERDNLMTALDVDLSNFNSHAHVERDIIVLTHSLDLSISTHTLTWSVTCSGIFRTMYN